ncbi:MAG TPA: tRNA pseudouridine(55) synthase TruB [Burkholderiaceae bacterium]|nr:tRNA pseudouridine(55) synthase TruB [Burkholderiaceae bacterium]
MPRRAVHGVLLLDKPVGLSSNDALQKARRLLNAEKAGHTGTLDPLASGLLPLCFGAATKFSQVSLDADKRYTATLHLGVTTTTADLEGEEVARRAVAFDRRTLDAVLARFTGPIAQRPPMHSALKHQGRALYEYAREGIEVDRPARDVVIHRLEVLSWLEDRLVLDVHCSKGTYVRTLAADLGEALGCGAHLAGLRRTGSGALSVDDAVGLDALASLPEAARDALLRAPDVLLAEWPECRLDAGEAARFLTGLRRRVALADLPRVRVYGPERGALLGAAHITAGELIPDRLLSPAEVQALLH